MGINQNFIRSHSAKPTGHKWAMVIPLIILLEYVSLFNLDKPFPFIWIDLLAILIWIFTKNKSDYVHQFGKNVLIFEIKSFFISLILTTLMWGKFGLNDSIKTYFGYQPTPLTDYPDITNLKISIILMLIILVFFLIYTVSHIRAVMSAFSGKVFNYPLTFNK